MDYGAELSADLLYSLDGSAFNRVRVSLGDAPVMVASVKVGCNGHGFLFSAN
jgi:hypothetical protein